MSSLKRTMTYAAYEPGAQGPWPKEKYEELYSIQAQILNAMAMLAGALAQLEPTWCKLLARNSNMMHPAFVRRLALVFCPHPALRHTPLVHTVPSKTAVCGNSLTHGSRLLTASHSLICSKPLSITASHLRRSYPSLSGWRTTGNAGDGCPSKETAKRARRLVRPSQQNAKRRELRTKMALRMDC